MEFQRVQRRTAISESKSHEQPLVSPDDFTVRDVPEQHRDSSLETAKLPLRFFPRALSKQGTSTTRSAFSLRRATSTSVAFDPPRNAQGLTLVHNPDQPTADIIFVHGLGGSSWTTWCWERNPEYFWPAWLRHEQGLSGLRVFTYGYNSDFLGPDTTSGVLDFAKGLLVRMRGYGGGESSAARPFGKRPIILAAHSMGGLVIKMAYILGKHDDHYSSMMIRVHGMFFFSTPHRGSDYAGLLNSILSVTIGASSKVYVAELEQNSTSINTLNEQFRSNCGKLHLISIYETLPTKVPLGFKKIIVDKSSGVLDYPKEISSPMNADHHSVCKYRSRIDDNYLLLISLLKQMTRDLETPYSPLVPFTSPSDPRTLRSILGIQGDPREDLDAYTGRALAGTCEWVRNCDDFVHWLSAPEEEPRLLYLTGLPGTGKSVLAARTITHLKKVFFDQSCQFHFFMDSSPHKRSISHCLRSIAFQIASTHEEFSRMIFRSLKDIGDSLEAQKPHVIWARIFEGVLFRLDLGYTLHWVIDAVDESEDSHTLLKLLARMRPYSCIKVMVLSRPNKDLASIALHSDRITYRMVSVRDTDEDISRYVRAVVKENIPKRQDIQKQIIERVITNAEGSFLWARLALDTLKDNWHTDDDIERAMSIIPSDMESLYQSMAAMIKKQGPRQQEISGRILTWAACSLRPIKLTELQVALEPEFGGFVSLRDTITQICGNFVRVDGCAVSLIHRTARQFLVMSVKDQPEMVPYHAGHEYLATTCLRYLCDDRWRRILSQVPESPASGEEFGCRRLDSIHEAYPFLQYAASNWAYHVRHSPVNSLELLRHLKLFFSKYALCWIQSCALAGRLQDLPRAAQHIKGYLVKVRRGNPYSWSPVTASGSGFDGTEIDFLDRWSIDLIRVVGKFGVNLSQNPSSIFKHIPPLCPKDSIISEVYSRQENPLLRLAGLSKTTWDDNLARLSLGQDVTASKVLCAGPYFLGLVSSTGTIVLWSAQTCEEIRRFSHGEWVVLVSANRSGSLMVSSGRFTIRLWDMATGEQLRTISKDPQHRVMDIQIGANDDELIVVYDDCSVVWYDIILTESSESGRFVPQGSEASSHHGCPRLAVLSPDVDHLAIAYRGRPVTIWDLASSAAEQSPRYCIRASDERRWGSGDSEVFNAPEVAVWHPDGNALYILYQDATVVYWNFVEDERSEFVNTEAREMAINNEGTMLLTSDFNGSLTVWSLPKFTPLYRLGADEFVRDLAFSPDSQRIYDVRGHICNVWEPEALVRMDLDRQDSLSSTYRGLSLPETVPETSYAEPKGIAHVTSLVPENDGRFFCCGRDDGSVIIHDMASGERVRKVTSHTANSDVIRLAWSASGRYLVSVDDSGKIITKKLRLKEDGKWAVYPVFEARSGLQETVNQILFSPDEGTLLISTATTDFMWDLTAKTQMCKRRREAGPGGSWISHPFDTASLLWVTHDHLFVHKWSNFEHGEPEKLSAAAESASPETEMQAAAIQNLFLASNNRFLGYQALSPLGRPGSVAEMGVFLVAGLQSDEPISRRLLPQLSGKMQCFLGCHRDRVAFVDQWGWICTSDADWDLDTDKIRRHFFLPRDWLGAEALQLATMTRQGVFLVPRNGDVAILRYAKGI